MQQSKRLYYRNRQTGQKGRRKEDVDPIAVSSTCMRNNVRLTICS